MGTRSTTGHVTTKLCSPFKAGCQPLSRTLWVQCSPQHLPTGQTGKQSLQMVKSKLCVYPALTPISQAPSFQDNVVFQKKGTWDLGRRLGHYLTGPPQPRAQCSLIDGSPSPGVVGIKHLLWQVLLVFIWANNVRLRCLNDCDEELYSFLIRITVLNDKMNMVIIVCYN